MSSPLLVLDCHYLCHRAFHTSDLEWQGRATGVIYGFLRGIGILADAFSTNRLGFCFEGGNLKRKTLFPGYKIRHQKEKTSQEVRAYGELNSQIRELREILLPKIGFRNIFCYPGYESDDSMAAIALDAPPEQDVILVTADSDLYQCLRKNVAIYSPQKQRLLTERWFKREYQITPRQWAIVKAMSGCHGDGVPGVPGIGEKTALKILQEDGKLTPGWTKAYLSRDIVRRNRKLVELPFEGCPIPEWRPDEISRKGWLWVCDHLGFKSLSGKMPIR